MGTGPESPLTPGWKESKTESGEVFFVNEITSAKVISEGVFTDQTLITWPFYLISPAIASQVSS